jgi:hypothetical protein
VSETLWDALEKWIDDRHMTAAADKTDGKKSKARRPATNGATASSHASQK